MVKFCLLVLRQVVKTLIFSTNSSFFSGIKWFFGIFVSAHLMDRIFFHQIFPPQNIIALKLNARSISDGIQMKSHTYERLDVYMYMCNDIISKSLTVLDITFNTVDCTVFSILGHLSLQLFSFPRVGWFYIDCKMYSQFC